MQVGRADHDEPAIGRAENVDRHAVQRTQRLGGDDVLRRTLDRGSARDVDDAVEVAEDRIDVVRDEQDGDVLLAADAAHERRDAGLVGEVETVERLVEQQQLRAARERLRDSRRCCSPPESSPIGLSAYAVAETSSITSATRRVAARLRAPGSGRPQRAPSSPSRTTSTPRMRVLSSKLRRCGR